MVYAIPFSSALRSRTGVHYTAIEGEGGETRSSGRRKRDYCSRPRETRRQSIFRFCRGRAGKRHVTIDTRLPPIVRLSMFVLDSLDHQSRSSRRWCPRIRCFWCASAVSRSSRPCRFRPNPRRIRCMPSTYRVMTLVKWAVLPLTVFTILLVVMRGQAKSSTNNGPKVTDVVSEYRRR